MLKEILKKRKIEQDRIKEEVDDYIEAFLQDEGEKEGKETIQAKEALL